MEADDHDRQDPAEDSVPDIKPGNQPDDGFAMGMLLLLVVGFPLFLASVFFVLYALFNR